MSLKYENSLIAHAIEFLFYVVLNRYKWDKLFKYYMRVK